MDPKTLSLADLEEFDPQAPDRGRNRRFLCPFCGAGKSKTAANRDLSANVETGAWECHSGGCGLTGKLREFWENRPPENKRDRQARELRQAFAPREQPQARPANGGDAWKEQLRGIRPICGSPGEAYLVGRGIPVSLAVACGVKFHSSVYGRPCVVFPARDRAGKAVGGQARFTDGREKTDPQSLKTQSLKDGGPGVFTTPGAWEGGRDGGLPIVLVEAPIDAMSLAVCGYPAMATFGSHLREWLPDALSFVGVLIGTDNDAPNEAGECAGDMAAEKWRKELRRCGVRDLRRLRPVGFKDWNGWLMADPDGLRAFLLREVGEPQQDPGKALAKVGQTLGESPSGEPGENLGKPSTSVEVRETSGREQPDTWEQEGEALAVIVAALEESSEILRPFLSANPEDADGPDQLPELAASEEWIGAAFESRDLVAVRKAAAELVERSHALRSNRNESIPGGGLFTLEAEAAGPVGLQQS